MSLTDGCTTEEIRSGLKIVALAAVSCVALALTGVILINEPEAVSPASVPLEPPAAIEWSSPTLREQYTVLYGAAAKACEVPAKRRQPQIDRYAELRQTYVADSVTVMDAPSPPTPERLIGC